jgi:hypothetical protein
MIREVLKFTSGERLCFKVGKNNVKKIELTNRIPFVVTVYFESGGYIELMNPDLLFYTKMED